MEVDDAPNKVMAASGTTGSVCVALHPLVIMNISEHWTRIRAQEGKPQQVIGALIGKQKGRNIDIMNSFELLFDTIEGNIVIDKDYYTIKEQQFKQVTNLVASFTQNYKKKRLLFLRTERSRMGQSEKQDRQHRALAYN